MNDAGEVPLTHLSVDTGGYERKIAVRDRAGTAPGVFWMSGFMSDMAGTKAGEIDRWCAARGLACTRFDYSAHGASGGTVEEGSLSRWLEESQRVFAETATGPRIVVGSSMGGYLAVLMARALAAADAACPQVAAMVLIAPAIDMTERLMWNRFPETVRAEIMQSGGWFRPSPYDDGGYRITRRLIEDGRSHLVSDGPLLRFPFPVAILQGRLDEDVPPQVALDLVAQLDADVSLTMVPDGDHRLSRPQDIALLTGTLARLAGVAAG